MSKRCKLQKEYYKEFGNYKGEGKYTDHYVNWLESKILAIEVMRCSTELCDYHKMCVRRKINNNICPINFKEDTRQ